MFVQQDQDTPRAAARALNPNHSGAVARALNPNHSRAVARGLSTNHSRAVARGLSNNHSRAVARVPAQTSFAPWPVRIPATARAAGTGRA